MPTQTEGKRKKNTFTYQEVFGYLQKKYFESQRKFQIFFEVEFQYWVKSKVLKPVKNSSSSLVVRKPKTFKKNLKTFCQKLGVKFDEEDFNLMRNMVFK